jgi:hypothetical protein
MVMPTKRKPGLANVVNAPRLPHERDEVPDASAPRKAVIVQAQRDVAAGLVDTDNYTRVPKVTQPVPARRRRAR